MAKKTGEFERWFKQQHGSVPSPSRLDKLHEEVEAIQYKLDVATAALEEELELHTRWTSAMYAWNAKNDLR